jgi:hypothetical protein
MTSACLLVASSLTTLERPVSSSSGELATLLSYKLRYELVVTTQPLQIGREPRPLVPTGVLDWLQLLSQRQSPEVSGR